MNRMCFIWNLAKGNEKLALHIQTKVKQPFDWRKTNQNNRILCSRFFFHCVGRLFKWSDCFGAWTQWIFDSIELRNVVFFFINLENTNILLIQFLPRNWSLNGYLSTETPLTDSRRIYLDPFSGIRNYMYHYTFEYFIWN